MFTRSTPIRPVPSHGPPPAQQRRPRVRRMLLLTMAGALTAGMITAGPAFASGSQTPTGQADQSDTAACTLRPSEHRSELHEWASCLNVSAVLSSAPAIGETATLTIDVRASAARPGTAISVELPDTMSFVSAPAASTTRTARQSDGTGDATVATTLSNLDASTSAHLTALVRADAPGLSQIRVRAVAPINGGSDAGSDDVFLTVGAIGAASRFGGELPTSAGTLPAPTSSVTDMPGRTPKAVPTDGLPAAHSDDAAVSTTDGAGPTATSCAIGRWNYYDEDGDLRPSINYQVQVWDQDSSTEDDLLITGVTNFSGDYNLCFTGADGEGGGQEVYVKFISSNSIWRVRNTKAQDDSYVNTTSVKAICDGCTADFGSLIPSNDIHRGMNAFDSGNDFWVWLPSSCWDAIGACRQAIMNWTATSVDGTYYSLGDNDVHLAADDPNAPHTVVHELSHSAMDDTYEDDFPPAPNCSPHYIQGLSSQGCAWTEGFAEWVPASVYNDPYYRWPNGASLNLETPTWGTAGWDSGDQVEGRIAGSMIDISDSANEVYWDRYSEGDPSNQWSTFQAHVNDTFPQFWSSRAADGYNTLSTGARASVYQNTIDYTFRDPLSSYAQLSRPKPTPHNFSASLTTTNWSVVGMRPSASTNNNLTVYDDSAQSVSLGSSSQGTGITDFVAIDNNHRAADVVYPRTTFASGTGSYDIELAQGSQNLSPGSQTISMSSTDVVVVRDVTLSAGVEAAFKVTGAGSQDAEIFLMDSDPGSSSTWVRARSSAVRSSSSGGAGAAESFTYTPGTTDTFGFVLVNKAGSGTYTVLFDTTAPSAGIQIEQGAQQTIKRKVKLQLTSTDAQTGVSDMRLSTDGTMDTEPWVAFSPTATVKLTGGGGTKTVRAQFRNGVGQQSAVVSDTITLDVRPDLRTTKISKAPKNVAKGDTFKVTDTVKNFGINKAKASVTKYYLSANKKLDAQDIAFAADRSVGKLKHGKQSKGTTTVKVKGSTATGKYYVLACGDGTGAIGEANENNNCRASKNKVKITASLFVGRELPE